MEPLDGEDVRLIAVCEVFNGGEDGFPLCLRPLSLEDFYRPFPEITVPEDRDGQTSRSGIDGQDRKGFFR